jgi:NADPH:quinone reductase
MRLLRAAHVSELGNPPRVVEVEGDGPIEIAAVALNPLDLGVAAGRFYGGHPPLPYVPGCEAVGRLDGERIYVFGDGRGTQRDGFLVERVDFPPDLATPVPEGLDDAVAAACGIAGISAWLPLSSVAPVRKDDRVLVLGATGTLGSIAVQAARLLGAQHVVAAGRDTERLERARQLGADEAVSVEGEDLAERLREASGGQGPTLVLDGLWAEPLRAAVEAAAPGARIAHVGQSAGPETTLASAAVRGKRIAILGYSYFPLTPAERAEAYREVTEHVAAGRITVDVETFSLDQIADAWAAQQAGAKAVVRL